MRRVAHRYSKGFSWPKTVAKQSSKKQTGKTNWKKVQNQGKTSKNLRLGILVLVAVVSLILFSRLLDLIGSLSRPLNPENSTSFSKINWDGKTIFHLALKSEETFLLSYNPLGSTLTLAKIPAETQVAVPFGYGIWPMRSVYPLGQTEKNPIGGRLFKETMADFFGVNINGYIIIPEGQSNEKMEVFLDDFRQNPLVFLSLVRSGKTDLTPLELWTLWRGIHGVRNDKIKTVNLDKIGVITMSRVDYSKLDEFFRGSFVDENLKDEGLSIGIFNATDHPGLAEKAARVISNLGGRVIFTANLEEGRDASFIMAKPSYSQMLLMNVFTPNCRVTGGGFAGMFQKGPDMDKCTSQDSRLTASSADVNLVLGEDLFLRYNKEDSSI